MEPADDADVVARRDDVELALIRDGAAATAALGFLDTIGSVAAAPVVDEAERARLVGLVEGRTTPAHRAALARRGAAVVGYVGVVTGSGSARADVAIDHGDAAASALAGGLAAAEEIAGTSGARRLEVWLRRAHADDVERAVASGLRVERRLAVLGRRIDEPPAPFPAPDGVTIRPYAPEDEQQVVAVLAAAYAGTSDGDWDLDAFRSRRAYGWFDPDDLLVAAGGDAALLGLHWTKRRSDRVGEVYNLAVAPRAQGRRLGPALLAAGLRHLHGRGARDVLLWVDRANERAVALYTSHGFSTRWEDVALTREPG